MTLKWIWAMIMGLAACGGGDGGDDGSGIDPRLARIDIYEAQKLRVLGEPGAGVVGMAPTPVAAIPDMGRAAFHGSATIRTESTTTPLVLLGDAAVTIEFEDAAISGTLDGFFGTNSAGDVVDYSGSITVDGGTLGADMTLDYAGALSAPGETLVISGEMTGALLGNPVTALSAGDLTADAIHNGSATDATLIVIAETTGVSAP